MNNYYEILEVSQNASQEIIEKAYKTLVKKYHPDMQHTEEEKQEAEGKIKLINEAYDILSNPEKRNEYNINFKNTYIEIEKYNLLLKQNKILKNTLNNIQKNNFKKTEKNNYEQTNYNINQKYYDNNYSEKINTTDENTNQNLNNNSNYSIKKIIILLILLFVIILLLQIPAIQSFFLTFLGQGNFLILILVIIGFIYFFKNSNS